MSVAVWVGFIALFGVAEDDSVLICATLAILSGSGYCVRRRRSASWWLKPAGNEFALLPDGHRHDRARPDPRVSRHRPRVRRDAADGDSSVGGMAVGLVTLFVTPCVYCWVEERKVRSRTREEKTPARGHPLP